MYGKNLTYTIRNATALGLAALFLNACLSGGGSSDPSCRASATISGASGATSLRKSSVWITRVSWYVSRAGFASLHCAPRRKPAPSVAAAVSACSHLRRRTSIKTRIRFVSAGRAD